MYIIAVSQPSTSSTCIKVGPTPNLPAIAVWRIDVTTKLNKELDNVRMTSTDCIMKGSYTFIISCTRICHLKTVQTQNCVKARNVQELRLISVIQLLYSEKKAHKHMRHLSKRVHVQNFKISL